MPERGLTRQCLPEVHMADLYGCDANEFRSEKDAATV